MLTVFFSSAFPPSPQGIPCPSCGLFQKPPELHPHPTPSLSTSIISTIIWLIFLWHCFVTSYYYSRIFYGFLFIPENKAHMPWLESRANRNVLTWSNISSQMYFLLLSSYTLFSNKTAFSCLLPTVNTYLYLCGFFLPEFLSDHKYTYSNFPSKINPKATSFVGLFYWSSLGCLLCIS